MVLIFDHSDIAEAASDGEVRGRQFERNDILVVINAEIVNASDPDKNGEYTDYQVGFLAALEDIREQIGARNNDDRAADLIRYDDWKELWEAFDALSTDVEAKMRYSESTEEQIANEKARLDRVYERIAKILKPSVFKGVE